MSEKPEAVINAIGIVKQRAEAAAYIPSLEINSLLPHHISEICGHIGARVIHFSTDCVFSGNKGQYTERDNPDPIDLYGRTKLLGEIGHNTSITLRTSIIGLELKRKTGLVEWFLAQHGRIRGFTRALSIQDPQWHLSRLQRVHFQVFSLNEDSRPTWASFGNRTIRRVCLRSQP